MRPNNNGEDIMEMKKKMESLEEKLKEREEKLQEREEKLKEKDEDFECLQDSYQALLVKERNNNYQLQDAREKLINVSCLVVLHFNMDFMSMNLSYFSCLARVIISFSTHRKMN